MAPRNHACIVGIADTSLENGRLPGGATVIQIQARAARDALALGDEAPYAIAIVELAEGPRMMSNIVTDDLSRIAVDGAVRVAFDAVTEDITLPKFRMVEVS